MSAVASVADISPPWRSFIAIVIIALAALWPVAALAIGAYLPPERGEMGVVFPPWVGEVEAMRAILAAEGRIVSASRFSNIVIAYADDAGFASRITAHGALFVTAARGLCAPLPEQPS